MLKRTTIGGILLALLAGFLVSCESFQSALTTSPPIPSPGERRTLRRVALPPDAVIFDALLIHVPYDDRDLARNFWEDVDEQTLDADLRRRFSEQGFRAGLIGASVPESLSRLLSLKGRALRTSIEEEVDLSKQDATLAPIAYSKPVNLRTGMKSLIEARDDVIPSIPVLENQNGALVGKCFNDAQALFSVSIEQIPDGSVRFDVTPFLRYGAPQPVTRYQHGQLVRTQEQPTKTFENLKCSLALRPGQFLAIGAADAKTNALGRYFFTDGGDDYDQKILVLRLLVTQHDGQFDQFPDFEELARRESQKNVEFEGNGVGDEGTENGGSDGFEVEIEGFQENTSRTFGTDSANEGEGERTGGAFESSVEDASFDEFSHNADENAPQTLGDGFFDYQMETFDESQNDDAEDE